FVSQNSAIFFLFSSLIGSSLRKIIASGWMPSERKSLTLCCVGFVLISPAALIYGTNVQCTYITWSRPISLLICRIASKKGKDSISPTVPPISVITTSAFVSSPALYTCCLISFVTWGITCTVAPLYLPFRSLFITLEYTFPVVILLNLFKLISINRS